ncbi:MAG: cysteine hydrolase [Rhodospirillaceae bacterium]
MKAIRGRATALLAIDLQNDFLDVRGRMPVDTSQVSGLLKATNRLLVRVNEKRWPIIYVVSEFSPWDYPANLFRNHAAIRGNPGAEIDRRVVKVQGERFSKSKENAFSNPELTAYLISQGVSDVVLIGAFAEGCVWRTAKGALREGFEPMIVSDAVASGSDRRRTSALEKMNRYGLSIVTAKDLIM